MLAYSSELIGKFYCSKGIGWELLRCNIFYFIVAMGPFLSIFSISNKVPIDILLSSNPINLMFLLYIRTDRICLAPNYPRSFHLRSRTLRFFLFACIISAIKWAKWWEIRLFFRSINYKSLLDVTNPHNAARPTYELPILFH
jgi:hypothetical protein